MEYKKKLLGVFAQLNRHKVSLFTVGAVSWFIIYDYSLTQKAKANKIQ